MAEKLCGRVVAGDGRIERPWGLSGCKICAKLFDLPLPEAERIVRHRADGPFASVDALKGVAGVTTAKIDGRAREIEF